MSPRHHDSFPPPRVLTRLGADRDDRPFLPRRPDEWPDVERLSGDAAGDVAGARRPAPRARPARAPAGRNARAEPARGPGLGSLRGSQPPASRPASRRPLELPETIRASRLTPSSTALAAVTVALLLVAAVFGARVWWVGRQSPQAGSAPATSVPGLVRGSTTLTPPASPQTSPPAPSAPAGRSGPVSGGVTAGAAPSGASTPASAGTVLVHVVGIVRHPGMVRLQPGARVADAVGAAGGAARGADLAAINLARPVVDGEQIRVPRPGEQPTPAPSTGPPGAAAGSPGLGGGGGGGQVSINSADLATLDTLPGVGQVLAQRIVDWRTEHGRFTSVDELGEVSGIGEKLLAQLRPKVSL